MAANEKTPTSKPTSVEAEIQEDLLLYGGRGWGKNASWFVFSTVAHVLLLGVLATLTFTMTQKRDEMIRVKTLPMSAEEQQQAQEEKLDDDWEGEPSLKDLPGLLTMEQLTPRQAKTSTSPPPALGAPAPVRPSALSTPPPPVMTGLGPMTIGIGPDNAVPQLGNLANAIGSINGAIGGIGGGFGDYVGGLRKVGLDVALVIDTTDSMQFVTDSVKSRLLKLVTSLRQMVPTSRIGIVAYRDKGEEYVTRWVDLSFSTGKIQDFLANLRAGGGGDWPEAVYEALETAVNDLNWRKKSKRIIILVPGSPPHSETVSNVLHLAQSFQAQGGVLSVVDLAEKMHEDFERALHRTSLGLSDEEFKPTPLPGFYQEFRNTMASIAQAGGGDFIPLTEDKTLTRQIIVLTFGSRWQTEMAKYLRDLE
ncbi:MAG TPA: vWA domain-containing protein [Methylomirabilota bacterium]|nr:vWA domain-containing protein [Methylomirabilota bacterium]